MRLRIVPASIELLDVWMDAEGWAAGSACRYSFRDMPSPPTVLAAVRGFDLLGLAGFVRGVEGSPVVIVHPAHRLRGIGTRLLKKLEYHGVPLAWACTPGGARLCKRVGVKFVRVRG